MSDAVAIEMIRAIPATIGAVAGIVSTVLIIRSRRTIRDLETNTNSIKDALVKVTGEEAFNRGLKQGQESGSKQ